MPINDSTSFFLCLFAQDGERTRNILFCLSLVFKLWGHCISLVPRLFVESRCTDRHLFDTRTVESHYSGVDEKMRSLLCCRSNIPWPNCHSAVWFSTKKTWIIHSVGRLLALIEKPARDEQLFLIFPGWGANYGYFSWFYHWGTTASRGTNNIAYFSVC